MKAYLRAYDGDDYELGNIHDITVIPRVGDQVVVPGMRFRVKEVAFQYSNRTGRVVEDCVVIFVEGITHDLSSLQRPTSSRQTKEM